MNRRDMKKLAAKISERAGRKVTMDEVEDLAAGAAEIALERAGRSVLGLGWRGPRFSILSWFSQSEIADVLSESTLAWMSAGGSAKE